MKSKTLFALCASVLVALSAPASAQLKSPDTVKVALRLLVQVSNDMKRQITAMNYPRVPHEDMEFNEAADGLRMTIKDEPDAFRTMVEPRLAAAVKAANDTSDLSMKDMNVPDLMAAHAKVVVAMNAVFDLFPADLRPDPNAAPGRRAPAAQNPPPAQAPQSLDPADLLPSTE